MASDTFLFFCFMSEGEEEAGSGGCGGREGAFLQWPFMPCEKYTSLSVWLMKALSCSCPPSSCV